MIRQLVRAPRFSIPVVAGLALAIGATTAVFSVFNAMLLRPMGFADPRSLVAIWRSDEPHGQKSVEVSYGDLLEWRKATGTLGGLALASSVNLDFSLFTGGAPQHVDGTTVTGDFFQVLGATPLVGRLLASEDDRPGAPARVVISYRLWRESFAADPDAVGREIRLGPGTATVVGVARPEFDYPAGVDVWVSLHSAWPDVEKSADLRVFRAVARMQAGIRAPQALESLDAMVRHAEPASTSQGEWRRVRVTPMLDEIYGAARPAVWILFGAVFLVLLIACVNATHLLLNRGAERTHELAIRVALGASRWRLLRLLTAESVVLGTTAGVLGVLLAAIGVETLAKLAPASVPRIGEASIEPLVLAFAMALTLITILLFGAGPAAIVSRRDPIEGLRQAGRGWSSSTHNGRFRAVLIASEGALCALLLVIAGALLHAFFNMAAIDPGFRPERVLTFRVTLEKPDQASRRAFYTEVLDRLRSLPGVDSAGAVLIRPLSGAVGWDTTYTVPGQAPARQSANPNGNYEAISPDYFRTMGISLLAGRDFTRADTADSAGVVIIDETTAKRHWPRGNAVGRQLRLGANPAAPWLTIVGVVKPVRYREWEVAWPDLYVPYTQRAQHRSDFVVKAKGDPWKLAAAVRREVFAVDKEQPISNLTTMDALVDRALSQSRFNGLIIGVLGACALFLAAIGIYSVLAYAVTQRRGEIGVRMAMGATPARVVTLVAGDGLRPLTMGLLAGLIASLSGRRLLAAVLFGVGDFDAAAYAFAAVTLLLVALAACAAPALRAASVDPARALRSE